jgi:thioredoxin reductase/ferredoxin
MRALLRTYSRWLHTRWPAGVVERLPEVRYDGSTEVPGLYVTGDLTGVPLLKFAADGGTKAVRTIAADPAFAAGRTSPGVLPLVIVGAGVSGMAAALEARKLGMPFVLLEAAEPFSTIVNFPKGKPIFTYPAGMRPEGELQVSAAVKEDLVDELRAQTLARGIVPRRSRVERVVRRDSFLELVLAGEPPLRARAVIAAIGRSGDFRRLGVPGEERGKVSNRLHDPKEFAGKQVLVVGGGDSALEAAVALAQGGAAVTLSYRGEEFSRPKEANVENLRALMADPAAEVAVETPSSERVTTGSGAWYGPVRMKGSIALRMKSRVQSIGEADVSLRLADGTAETIANDAVFTMIGRDAPLEFFRRSGVKVAGEMGPKQWAAFAAFFLFCSFVYLWKAGGSVTRLFQDNGWFPFNVPSLLAGLGQSIAAAAADPSTPLGTIAVSLADPGFYYALAYTLLVLVFGVRRIKRRRTPYVTAQTATLALIQLLPLFLLPYFILPLLGQSGVFDAGGGKAFADALFPEVSYGHGREYWRAFGLVLAWPLFVWNVFTAQPLWWWLGISLVQTFVLVPLIVWKWGKGAYCGWICSCGAMAETLGDTHRHKMPHGAGWNRANMLGQVILALALLLLLLRVAAWAAEGTVAGRAVNGVFSGLFQGWELFGVELNYKHVVDLFLAGIVGYGAYFWFSGRVWCRFACPLAALMHIYARFSRFRIVPDKKKCISCSVCTTVCHQGIDVMNFANKGLPMEDPECVRCSACVQSCPTGVLQFGEVNRATGAVLRLDRLAASPVRMREEARP